MIHVPAVRMSTGDVLVTGGVALAAAGTGASLLGRGPEDGVFQVLTLAAAATGAAAAILGELTSRLLGHPHPARFGAACGVYSLVVVPLTTIGLDRPSGGSPLDVVRLAACVTVLVLLALAARGEECGRPRTPWVVAGAGTATAIVGGLLLDRGPVGALLLVVERGLGYTTLAGWGAVAVLTVVQGRRRGSRALLRIGVGIGVLAVAQAYRTGVGSGAASPETEFAALRLAALVVVTVGLAGLWRDAHDRAREDERRRHEALRTATSDLRRAAASGARRDHELRNALGGLSAITELLGSPGKVDPPLRLAVAAELARLHGMVDGVDTDGEGVTTVGPVLRELTALHRARGLDVRCRGETDPVGLPGSVLRQVLTNLVLNAERHAPGTPIVLAARQEGPLVVVEVRDGGPGVPAGREEAVFEAGTRAPGTPGSGLGLAICRDLLTVHGGTIRVAPADPTRPGCAVELGLVTAGARAPALP